MNPIEQFKAEREERIKRYSQDKGFKESSLKWTEESMQKQYVYNFEWMGRPIIQYPQDIMAMQEIFWNVKPDLIIETGVAHGGSIIFSASMLELIGGDGQVIGIDIDVREHNRSKIEDHSMYERITLIEGSSVSKEVHEKVQKLARGKKKILVILDSNHTHDHVLEELNLYGSMVSKNSYLIVLDTFVEDMPKGFFKDRPWDVGNNPKTAVKQFLNEHPDFSVDQSIEDKLMITVAPQGYLKRA